MIAVVAAGLVVLALWWWQNRSLTADEQALFSKIESALAQAPPEGADVIRAFRLPSKCETETCFLEPSEIDGLQYEGGNLRQQKNGNIFVLEALSGQCIRRKRVMTYFGSGAAETSCSSKACWYTTAQYEWGILAFGLDERESACISSVVINSLPYQRPQPAAQPTMIDVDGRAVCVENCEN